MSRLRRILPGFAALNLFPPESAGPVEFPESGFAGGLSVVLAGLSCEPPIAGGVGAVALAKPEPEPPDAGGCCSGPAGTGAGVDEFVGAVV